MIWAFDYKLMEGTMVDHFFDENHYRTTLVITDGKGKILLDVVVDSIRVKKN